jgi:hypothetical protein
VTHETSFYDGGSSPPLLFGEGEGIIYTTSLEDLNTATSNT